MASLQDICIEIAIRTSAGITTIRGNFTDPKEAADYLRKLAEEMAKLHAEIAQGNAAQHR